MTDFEGRRGRLARDEIRTSGVGEPEERRDEGHLAAEYQ